MEKSNFSIKVTPIASEDLDSIYTYISTELANKNAASNILEQIESSIMRLQQFPFSCPFVEDDYLKIKGYRKLIIDNYIAFYVVDEIEKQVTIMRILYDRRNYRELL